MFTANPNWSGFRKRNICDQFQSLSALQQAYISTDIISIPLNTSCLERRWCLVINLPELMVVFDLTCFASDNNGKICAHLLWRLSKAREKHVLCVILSNCCHTETKFSQRYFLSPLKGFVFLAIETCVSELSWKKACASCWTLQ